MGDHRAHIKIEMEFHGIKDKADMSINYCDSDGNGVDSNVTEFFSRMYDRGMAKYHAEMDAYYAKQNATKLEEQERKELERLKAKYEGNK